MGQHLGVCQEVFLERRENAVKLSSASKTCFSLMLHAEYSPIA